MMPAVVLKSVAVRYRLPKQRIPTLKEYAIHWLKRRIEYQDLWALRDVSLTVNRGEMLGVIGRNGAGKSTLLKVIARVMKPTSGQVIVHGRVAPLLEITAGFDPELTGRENIYLNGAILGLSKREIDYRFDAIVDFAELADFIDAPIRTYSTGMMTRLGFAIATDANPDILLVDEVLAVGDERFQLKCQDRMDRFRRQGVAIVLVTHNVETIRALCDRAVWLERGAVEAIGDGREVAFDYQEFLGTGARARERLPYFHPDWTMTRAEFVRLIVLALNLNLVSPNKPTFKDVLRDSPYYVYIETAAAYCAIRGAEPGEFWPNQTITRAQAITIAARLCHTHFPTDLPTGFEDVPENAWYADALRTAKCGGFLPDGLDHQFKPLQGLNRAEAVQIVVRLACLTLDPLPSQPTFQDVPVTNPAWKDVEIATAYGLIPTANTTGKASSILLTDGTRQAMNRTMKASDRATQL